MGNSTLMGLQAKKFLTYLFLPLNQSCCTHMEKVALFNFVGTINYMISVSK
jgi:hypothetical protein